MDDLTVDLKDDAIPSHLGYKVRLYPTPSQEQRLSRAFGCARFVFNQYINWCEWEYENGYRDKETRVSFVDKRSILTSQNKEQYPWLAECSASSLQEACSQAKDAYWQMVSDRSAGKKASTPRRRKSDTQSIRLPGKTSFDIRVTDHKRNRGHIYIPKVGWVRYHGGKDISKASSVTISLSKTGDYYASVTLKPEEKHARDDAAKACGVDMGLDRHLTLVNTNREKWEVTNPRHIKKAENALRSAHRKLSRKQKGSSNRKKARLKLAKAYENVSNHRRDHLHKVSKIIADNNHAVVMETLGIQGMVRNHCLAKAIHDVAWGALISMVDYKVALRGGSATHVNRFLPSSQTCSQCGHVDGKKTLDVRVWKCPNCGAVLDRDFNSSTFLIDAGGHSESLNACGADVRRLLSAPLSAVKQEYFPMTPNQSEGDNPNLSRWVHIEKPRP